METPRTDVPHAPVRRWLLGRAALGAVLATYFLSLRLYSGHDIGTEWVDADLGQRAAQAIRVLNGQLPYRDFWAPYSPAPYFVNAALFHALGARLSSFRFALALVGAASAFLAYVVTRRVGSRAAALAACALTASWSVIDLNVNYGTWYCIPVALGAVWGAVVGVQRAAWWPWLVAGICAGLTLSLKSTYGLYTVCAVGVAALAGRGTTERGLPRLAGSTLLVSAAAASLVLIGLQNRPTLSTLLHFGLPLGCCAAWAGLATGHGEAERPAWPRLWLVAAGVALAFGPWIFYFAARWAALPFLQSVFIGYAEMGEFVALQPALPNARAVCFAGILAGGLLVQHRQHGQRARATVAVAAITVLGCLLVLAWPRPFTFSTDRWLFTSVQSWVHVRSLLPVLVIWTAILRLWRRRGDAAAELPFFAVTVGATAIFLSYFPFSDVNHFQWAWPAQAVLACVLLDRLTRGHGRAANVAWLLPVALAALQWFALATHFVRPEREGGPWERRTFQYAAQPAGDVLVPAPNARAIDGAVELIRALSPADAPVLELNGHCLGFLAARRNATRYDYFWPGFLDEADQRETIAVLRADPPGYVIGNKRSPEDEPLARFTEYFPLLGAYLQTAYRPYRTIGPYQFYAPRPDSA